MDTQAQLEAHEKECAMFRELVHGKLDQLDKGFTSVTWGGGSHFWPSGTTVSGSGSYAFRSMNTSYSFTYYGSTLSNHVSTFKGTWEMRGSNNGQLATISNIKLPDTTSTSTININTSVPTSGMIDFNDFYGASAT